MGKRLLAVGCLVILLLGVSDAVGKHTRRSMAEDELAQEFSWAVKNDDMEVVKSMFAENPGKNLVTTPYQGRTPLHVAADYGQKEVMEFLISKGANVNEPDKYGITPLLAAIYEGHTECVSLLLEKGANKNGTAPDGTSYIDCADKDDIKALLQ